MTPKEKAKELVNTFKSVKDSEKSNGTIITRLGAKQCALICVDEILEHAQMIDGEYNGYRSTWFYFSNVKNEIEKL